ncbi:MAG TPA: UDP-N-acetyl-D-mannosamine dehydrogenase [Hyphomicrobiaceae bacterium]|nr:UDP-N-acetyl-D-mannosamine dehydrogenase [Hyphomicrobiaceae bacterium]
MKQKVCVLGLGYVGLPTASLLGSLGYEVCGVDIDEAVVTRVGAGELHFSEPGLEALVKAAVRSGNLQVSTEASEADVFIIAVPTPVGDDREPDLSKVEAATKHLVPYLRPGNLVILESTCPVGTTEGLVAKTLAASGLSIGDEVLVAHCPERVLPGKILQELLELDRVVGGINDASTDAAAAFFSGFVNAEVHRTNARTAEITKLVENAYRDVNVAFANELSLICHRDNISVFELIELANLHPRVNILNPGPGVGGHCIAVDPWFIISQSPKLARLMTVARTINDGKPDWVVEQVTAHAKKFLKPVIACLGLTYKADVDDLRESPALKVARQLKAAQLGELLVSEPNLRVHPDFELLDASSAVERADIVVVLVAHKEFRALAREKIMPKVVIDTVGIYR